MTPGRLGGRILVSAVTAVLLALATLFAVAWLRGWTVAQIRSASMRPALDRGDLVVLVPVAPGSVRANDVVAFRDARDRSRLVAHRVRGTVEHEGRRFLETKGDANPQPDVRPLPEEEVIGRAAWTIPHVGSVVGWFTGPRRLLLVAVPGILLVAAWRPPARKHEQKRSTPVGS